MGTNFTSGFKQVRVHEATVSPTCLRLIQDLSSFSFIKDFYLVGGTALALQLGHRKSIDLDFFTSTDGIDYSHILQLLQSQFNVIIKSHNKNFLKLEICDVKTEFIHFAYAPKFDLVDLEGIKMVHPLDIGLYKLLAILGRSTKKDIVDLFMIDKEIIKLEDLFKIFVESFDKSDTKLFEQTDLLFIPDRLDASDMPEMLIDFNFNEALEVVREKILNAIKTLL